MCTVYVVERLQNSSNGHCDILDRYGGENLAGAGVSKVRKLNIVKRL